MNKENSVNFDQPASRTPMRMLHLERPFSRFVSNIPKTAMEIPSMMSVAERRFLYGLASKYYSGEGVIIDAGIFLGASTRCFGEGVRQNSNLERALSKWECPVISFERGIVTPTMPAFFKRNSLNVDLAPGESFAPLVKENTQTVSDIVDLRIGDIQETGGIDHPIEILFLDVLKLPEINKYIVEQYYPKLIPGKSIVIQQDYFYDLLPYIKTYQEYFGAYFQYVGEIGSTAAFLCTREITKEATLGVDTMVADEQIRLAGIALQRSIDPARRFLMALSKARLIRKLQGAKAAQNYLHFVKSEFPIVKFGEIPRLREALRATELACRAKGASADNDVAVD